MILLITTLNVAAQSPAKTIPSFSFYKPDKTIFTEQKLAEGRLLFFMFFDADCDHCQRTMSYFNRHYNEFNKVAVYFITVDTWDKANQFMKKFGINFSGRKNVTLLQDSNNEFVSKFGPKKFPSVFLYTSKKELLLYDDEEKNMSVFLTKIKADK